MKTAARFHVMVLAPLIGRPESARRVRVAYHAYTLEDALYVALGRHAWPRWPRREAYWIQHRDETAHTQRRPRR